MIVNPTRISFSNFSDSRDVNGLPMVSCADESALDLNVSRLVFSPQSSIAPKNDSPLIRMDHEALEIQVPVKKKKKIREIDKFCFTFCLYLFVVVVMCRLLSLIIIMDRGIHFQKMSFF